MRRAAAPMRERLESRREIDKKGCWLWTGARSKGGYGQIRLVGGTTAYTHREAYEEYVGPIPAGLHIDHLCRDRACFNPSHLEPVTPGENARRGLTGAHLKKTPVSA